MAIGKIDFEAILRALAEQEVAFIVVGGVCAALHGAPVSTFDLDILYSREAANLERLEAVLSRINARYRQKPEVAPEAHRLEGPGHHLLSTDHGPLDLLGSMLEGKCYEDLAGRTARLELGPGLAVLALDLETLIEAKERLGRDRDLALLPILRRVLREKSAG